MILAAWWYNSLIGLIAIAGIALIVYAWRPRKPRGRPLLLSLVGLAMIVAPLNLDLFVGRVSKTPEKWTTAWVPTTVMLWMLGEPDGFAYGRVFDRYHKAPARHQFWGWQQSMWANWCADRMEAEDSDLRIRAIQISATLAPEVDQAVLNLGKALSDSDPLNRRAACDALAGLGKRAGLVQDQLKAASESEDEDVAETAKTILKSIGQ